MPKFEKNKREQKEVERSNAQDLAARIRRHKLQKELEEDEKEEEKNRRREQEEETQEDDENLKEEEEEEERGRKKKKEEEDEEEEDEEEGDEGGEEDKEEEEKDEEEKHGEEKDEEKKDEEKKDVEEKDSSSSNENSSDSEELDKTENVQSSDNDINQQTDKIKVETENPNSNVKPNVAKGAGEETGSAVNTGAVNTGASVTEATGGATEGSAAGTAAEVATAKKVGEKVAEQAAEEAERAELAEIIGTSGAGEGISAGTAGATGGAGAGTAAGAGAGAGTAEAVAGTGVTGAGIGVLGIALIIILILIVVIGIIFFFITMPGMVVGKIGDAINSFRENVEAFMDGNNAAKIFVNREQVLGAAEYLNQMGYDLDGFGFLDDEVKKKMTAQYNEGTWASIKDWWSSTDESDSSNLPLKNFNTKNLSERKEANDKGKYQEVYLDKYDSSYSDSDIRNHILLAKDADGEITFAKSKYLATYLSAENAIYLIRNDNTDIFNRAAKLIGINDANHGSGLMYFINASDRNIADYVANANNINFKDPEGWFGYNRVNIFKASKTMIIKNADDGWFKSSNYTYSLDGWASKYGVPLQLSLALHLSSLAPDFALDVATRGAEDTAVEMGLVENENINTKAVLYINLGNGKQYYKIEKAESKYRLIKTDGNVAVFEGTDVNGYFETGENNTPTVISNAFGGNLSAGEIGTFFDEVIALDIDTEDFTKYIPIILSVKDHWYQDLDFKGCYEYTGTTNTQYMKYTLDSDESNILQRAEDTIYVEETSSEGSIQQIAEPKVVGEPGEWIKGLIDNEKYYKYDGARKSDIKSKINFTESAVDAIAMLEQIKGEDSQDIIRMFKELMSSYNIYFLEAEGTKMKKDLFSKVIKNYSGTLLADGEDCVYKANIPPTQTGFNEDLVVQAPEKGKITYQTEDAVCIEFTDKSKPFYKYTLLISGFKVNENIGEQQGVKEGTELGKTIKQDLKLVLRDENGAIVKNKYVETLGNEEESEEAKPNVGEQDVRVPKRNPKYTEEELRKIFKKYGNGAVGRNLLAHVNDFYKLQTNYGVNPLFAAAVTIKEQSAGTAKSTCSRQNNWFSVRSGNGWAKFTSPSESIDRFGDMIANGSNYFTQGRYTIKQIGKKYCVPPDGWIKGVSKIMKHLEKCAE